MAMRGATSAVVKCRVLQVRLEERAGEADVTAVNAFLRGVQIKRCFAQIQNGPVPCWSVLMFYEEGAAQGEGGPAQQEARPRGRQPAADEPELTAEQQALFEQLRRWRMGEARKNGVPAYEIAYDRWLRGIARQRPESVEELRKVRGVTAEFAQSYGFEVLRVVRQAAVEGAKGARSGQHGDG